MRDPRDYLIAVLAAGLLFTCGMLVGRAGLDLPAAQAQGGDGFNPEQPVNQPGANTPSAQPAGGITINPPPSTRPGTEGRTVSQSASDSDSNNRFVAVTCPVGSGESVLFLIDAKNDQLGVYRYLRGKGLEFLAGRKIDIDMKIYGYRDRSEYTREKMKRMYDLERARAAARVAKAGKTKQNQSGG